MGQTLVTFQVPLPRYSTVTMDSASSYREEVSGHQPDLPVKGFLTLQSGLKLLAIHSTCSAVYIGVFDDVATGAFRIAALACVLLAGAQALPTIIIRAIIGRTSCFIKTRFIFCSNYTPSRGKHIKQFCPAVLWRWLFNFGRPRSFVMCRFFLSSLPLCLRDSCAQCLMVCRWRSHRLAIRS